MVGIVEAVVLITSVVKGFNVLEVEVTDWADELAVQVGVVVVDDLKGIVDRVDLTDCVEGKAGVPVVDSWVRVKDGTVEEGSVARVVDIRGEGE